MSIISEAAIRHKCAQDPWVIQTRNHIKFGTAPQWFEEIAQHFPQGSVERADYFKAAELSRDIYRQEIKKLFDMARLGDSRYIEDLCRAEPWTTSDDVRYLGNGTFGYVTEKLEHARDMFPEDSAEHALFDDAFEKAKILYFDHIKQMARQFATGRTRAEIEEVNASLWAWAGRLEGNGTYLRSRLIKVCEWNGQYYYQKGKPPAQDLSKAQYVIRPK
jgi:hypothetical protein